MNLRGWADELLAKLSDDDLKIFFSTERFYLPDANYNHDRDRIGIWGNGPSLARYGLAHLIAHELAHREHAKRYDGDLGDDFSDSFRSIEREMIEKIWALCLEEHD